MNGASANLRRLANAVLDGWPDVSAERRALLYFSAAKTLATAILMPAPKKPARKPRGVR